MMRLLSLVSTVVKWDMSELQLPGLALFAHALDRREARARLRPLAHGGDLLLHGLRERHGLFERLEKPFRVEVHALVERVVERADDRLLDLGARVTLARLDERV